MSLVLVHVGKRKRSLYWESKYVHGFSLCWKREGSLSFGRISVSRVIFHVGKFGLSVAGGFSWLGVCS